jgi:hypothetical protein
MDPAAEVVRRRGRPRTRLEPWLANYYQALRSRKEPLVFLLVSWNEAVQVADGQVSKRIQKQARRMLQGAALPPRPEAD